MIFSKLTPYRTGLVRGTKVATVRALVGFANLVPDGEAMTMYAYMREVRRLALS